MFSTKTHICEALKASYHLGQRDKVKEVAFLLQDEVLGAYTGSDLSSYVFGVPKQLTRFLSCLLAGKSTI